MVLVLYGFLTQTQALQFEWAWQKPERSKFARPVAQALKRHQRYGLHGKVCFCVGLVPFGRVPKAAPSQTHTPHTKQNNQKNSCAS